MPPTPSGRLPWLDHIRTLVILLVVNLHACVTYSHVGDWYLKVPPEPTMGQKIPFILWIGHLQAFFMGLLFFVSGYLAHGALARRGPRGFARERLLRLGLPALAYMLVLHPFILLGLNPWNFNFGPPVDYYIKYLRTGKWLGSSGPLWFAVALLLFCLVLAAWRALRSAAMDASARAEENATAPSAKTLWLFAFALGVGSFAVRIVQPIGSNVLNLQLCHFVQYIAAFAAGLHAARHGWLRALALSRRARVAGWLGLLGGPPLMVAVMLGGESPQGLAVFFGGLHWQALAFALWEQLAGVGLALGVLALAARKFDRETPVLRWLADRSFGVYVLHAPVIIGLAMLFRPLSPGNKYLLVTLLTVTGLAVSYALADLMRRVARRGHDQPARGARAA